MIALEIDSGPIWERFWFHFWFPNRSNMGQKSNLKGIKIDLAVFCCSLEKRPRRVLKPSMAPTWVDFGAMLGIMWEIGDIAKIIKNLQVFNEFSRFGGSKLASFSYFWGCLFQDRFLIVLGSVLGSIWGPFWHYNRTQIEEKTRLILGSIFGASLGANGNLFPGQGGPWGTPHMRAFSTKKMKRLEFNNKRRPKQEKGSTVLIIVQIIVGFSIHKLMI